MFNKIKKSIEDNMSIDEKYEYENKILLKEIDQIADELASKAKLVPLSEENGRRFNTLKKQAEHTNKELEKEYTRKKLIYMKSFMQKQLNLFKEKGNSTIITA